LWVCREPGGAHPRAISHFDTRHLPDMAYRFKKHYTRDEARAMLPDIRQWLKRLVQLRGDIEKQEERMNALIAPGCDIGGVSVNRWVRTLADIKELLIEFSRREIEVKDLDRGLIDFPAIIEGKEVFLCWEQEEEDIEFWHDLDAGYAGRERLME
jgi:hypothetical protein